MTKDRVDKDKRLSDRWLLQQLTASDLREWIKTLEFFYFFRAWGGHANDGDRFEAHIKFTDKGDLISKMGDLNIELQIIPEDYPRPEIGKSYPASEFDKFKSEIKDYPDLEQPGHVFINQIPVFIWIHSNNVTFSVSGCADGNRYIVTRKDFEACLEIESIFKSLNWKPFKNIDVESNVCCITQEKYGDILK